MKNYRLTAQDMVAGLADHTGCFATDRITVDGAPVGFMYRDDDGWNFFAGDESQDYVDDPANLGLFSLNDIANYDRAILPYLAAPPGSAWVRQGAAFVPDPQGAPADAESRPTEVNPDFPVVQGRFEMTSDWALTVTQPMNRRFEDDALVLWRPGLTAWITVWGNPAGDSPTARLAKLKQMSSPHRYDDKEWTSGDLLYCTYRLSENPNAVDALYGTVVGTAGHLQIALYFDHETDLAQAAALIGHVSANGRQTRSSLSDSN